MDKSLKVDRRIYRQFLQPNLTTDAASGGTMYEYGVRIGAQHGANITPACDEFGRQYVVPMSNDEREFSERIMIHGGAVDRVYIAHRILVDCIYGYNLHTSAVLFVQLWRTVGHDWAVNGDTVSNWTYALGSLVTQWPVQPNYGVFSIDTPWVYRTGLTIAISTTPLTWTSAGSMMSFTLMGRQRETGTNLDYDVNV